MNEAISERNEEKNTSENVARLRKSRMRKKLFFVTCQSCSKVRNQGLPVIKRLCRTMHLIKVTSSTHPLIYVIFYISSEFVFFYDFLSFEICFFQLVLQSFICHDCALLCPSSNLLPYLISKSKGNWEKIKENCCLSDFQ